MAQCPTGQSIDGTASPIARLIGDALHLVFDAANEASVACSQRDALRVPLALSHVCRRWRAVALEQPHLWSRIHWAPGDSVEAARALLQRSRSSLLMIDVTFRAAPNTGSETESGSVGAITDAECTDGGAVLYAVAPHLWRASHVRLEIPVDILMHRIVLHGSDNLLFAEQPRAMPHLRHLKLTVLESPFLKGEIWLLNITCPPLATVYLHSVLPRSWDGLLGPGTTAVYIMSCPIQLSELRHVLQLAPNMRRLDLTWVAIYEDDLAVETHGPDDVALGTQLEYLFVSPQTVASLMFLETLPIPISRIPTVIIRTHSIPYELAYDYLRIPELVDITEGFFTPGELSFTTACDVQRTLYSESTSFAVLHDLFARSPVLSTLTFLTVDFDLWPALVGAMAAARSPDPPSLPRLSLLSLAVCLPCDPEESPAGGDDSEVSRTSILAPALTDLSIELSGGQQPTLPFVRPVVRALKGLSAPRAVLLISDNEGESHLDLFGDILREEMLSSGLVIPILGFDRPRNS